VLIFYPEKVMITGEFQKFMHIKFRDFSRIAKICCTKNTGVLQYSGPLKITGVSVAVYAAKRIIQYSTTAQHAMRPFIEIL